MLQTWLRPLLTLLPPSIKRLARSARTALQESAETFWGAGFKMGGFILRPRVEIWSSPGAQRVLVVAPHPDDEAIGCAGTILRHKKSGDEVCIAYITDGGKSEALGLDPATMAATRKKEAEAAAGRLEIDRFEWIGLPEGDWTCAQLVPLLRTLLREFDPHFIYAPSRIDVHREHHKVAHALAEALSRLDRPKKGSRIRVYQIQVPLTSILVNLIVDTSDLAKESVSVLNAYTTQIGSTCRAPRKWRYGACFYGAKKHQEEFWEISAGQYCMLHMVFPEAWPTDETFQVIEFRCYTDPLAYLKGLDERRRLAFLVQRASQ